MSTTTHKIPETGILKIWHIIGNPEANPPIPALLPVGRTTLLNRVKDGTYPKPVKLGGSRSVGWPANEAHAINKAIIAGKSKDEIKALVIELEAARIGA